MVKKPKSAPAPAAPTTETPPVAPAAPETEKGMNDVFTRVMVNGAPAPALNADGTAKRVAPQLQVIADTIAAAGEAGVTRKALIEALTSGNPLKTRQPVGRIVSYYQKDLVNFGLAARTPVAEVQATEADPAAE
jgi:hypothetical protein